MHIIENYTPEKIPKSYTETLEGQITVIVAVYNIQSYLERCARSIMNQTYKNLQIILVDDGSTDASGNMCDELAKEDSRITVVHKKNGGLSDARNAGMQIATGTYLAFVDGDDWIDATMYEEMLGSILETDAEIAICRYRQIYPDQTIDESTQKAVIFEDREALGCLIAEQDEYQLQNAAWNKLYRRDLLQGQEFPKGRWYEDIVYTTILLSKIRRCVYLDRAFYNYVLEREGSIMSKGLNVRILTDQIPAYMEKTEFLKSIGEVDMADTHNYFTYKRLLILYTQFRRSKDSNRKKFCKELKNIILSEKDQFDAAFHCAIANPNEYKKMKIFLMSTTIYNMVMDMNDRFVIPYKLRKLEKQKEQ